MASAMDALFAQAKMKCTVCGIAFVGTQSPCDCWQKCECGWSKQKDQPCNNPECGGDGVRRAMMANH